MNGWVDGVERVLDDAVERRKEEGGEGGCVAGLCAVCLRLYRLRRRVGLGMQCDHKSHG